MRRWVSIVFCVCTGLLFTGCPRGDSDYAKARRAEALHDYDTALEHYQKALRADPFNANYRIKTDQMRFEASQFHVRQGQKLRNQGDLQAALAEFQRAFAIDASSSIAEQEIKATTEQIAAREKAADAASAPPHAESSEPPLEIGRAHVLTPVTSASRMPSSA